MPTWLLAVFGVLIGLGSIVVVLWLSVAWERRRDGSLPDAIEQPDNWQNPGGGTDSGHHSGGGGGGHGGH